MTDFRLLATGMSLSWLGNGFQTVALAVAVLVAGGGAGDLGLVMAASIVAMLLCTLFGGVWADRVQPQRVMVLSDAVRFVATAGITVMFGSGSYHLPVLCALAVVSAGAGAFFEPAMTTLKPMLVSVDRRQHANATLSLLKTGAAVLGPAIGGLTVAQFGATAGFAVNAASFLASLVAAALIRARAERGIRSGMLTELGAGWREIRARDWLLTGVLAAAVYHVANGVVLVLVQVVAIEQLGGARSAGFIAAAEGLGGVVGATIAMRWRPVRLLRAGGFTLLLMPFWALAYVWPGLLTAVLAGAVLGYAGLTFFSVAWDTALQDHIPHGVLARVSSWDLLTSFLAMPIGNALAGPLSEAFGINRVLVVCAVVLFGAGLAPLFLRSTRTLTRRTSPDTGEKTLVGVPGTV
ncbi:MFS transporter [Actinoplanes friuliensis]|uniref:Putative MFS transporter n=1 Tax=Actinoplanes friuliensis DSM 7358 TaxID=1246995 RepID=U5W6A6_9ACTN|nr:MFS transporter [Actinoplanes friuliensis]AGZ44723.1 putative MFS transporter [Actinoplanes friuliensis DSM 7358]